MPDSAAAASLIKILSKYLGLKIDVEPLLHEAEKFEEKLKNLVRQSEEAKKTREKKEISYLG